MNFSTPKQPCCASRPHAASRRPAARVFAQATAPPRVFKYKDVHRAWTAEFEEGFWRGFIGQWMGNLQDPPTTTSMQGLRTFRWLDPTRRRLDQINVYDAGRPGLRPRASDGLFQLDVNYTDKRTNPEAAEEPVPMEQSGIAAASPSAFASLSRFWLPPVAVAGPAPAEVLAAARAAAEGDAKNLQPIRSANWGMEVFLRDGDCRWSFPIVYDSATGELTRVTFIREYATTADPATPHVLAAHADAVLAPRPQLPDGDPVSCWLPLKVTHGSAPSSSSWAGRRVARLWSAPSPSPAPDGAHMLLDDSMDEPVTWDSPGGAPTESESTGARVGAAERDLLIRLPDSMYVRVPRTIAAAAAAEPAAAEPAERPAGASGGDGGDGGAVLRFEVGGLMRNPPAAGDGAALARIVIQYDRKTGRFVDLSHEVFAPASAP